MARFQGLELTPVIFRSSRHVLVARLTSNGTLAETVGRPLLWSVGLILKGEDTQPHRPSEGFSRVPTAGAVEASLDSSEGSRKVRGI